MLCRMAEASRNLVLEAYAQTKSKGVAPMEVPCGASSSLDPQQGQANHKVQLP
jgi:hypothetical protein